jgi:uncharacterized protein (TIGR02757 family)
MLIPAAARLPTPNPPQPPFPRVGKGGATPWKRAQMVKPALEKLIAGTNARERMRGDPIELPHRYSNEQDIEVAALLSAALAYGRVDLFKPRLTRLLEQLGPHPAKVAREKSLQALIGKCTPFEYRMTGALEVAQLLHGAGAMQRAHGSLGAAFEKHFVQTGELRAALGLFVDELTGPGASRRLKHLLPHPGRNSACKRLNLFLRWMIRGPDGVDFGLWRDCVPASALVIPLDTHVHRIGRFIGLTRRADLSWRTAEEVTSRLRSLDASDPVRYDFALSHLGISGTCASRKDARRCEGCPLKPICRFWT